MSFTQLKFILSCYVAMNLQMEDCCSANFTAHLTQVLRNPLLCIQERNGTNSALVTIIKA